MNATRQGSLIAATLTLLSISAWTGCTVSDPLTHSASTDDAELTDTPETGTLTPAPPAPKPQPEPPRPSLSRLTDKNRPNLEFFGAKIYADAILGSEAQGHVYLDGSNLHVENRSFPLAVYANHVRVDLIKGEVFLTGWPIVKTDSAYVQAQADTTTIHLNRNRMSQIDGPARYVIGDKGAELFRP